MKGKGFIIISAVGVSLFSALVNACDYHDGPRFGLYSRQNTKIQQYALSSNPTELSLKHAKTIVTNVNQSGLVKIEYLAPTFYKNLTLNFSATEGLVLESDNLYKLDSTKGEVQLAYMVNTTGEHHIQVIVDGLVNGSPYSRIQTIFVNSQP